MGCGASQPDVATEARGPPPGPKRQVSLKEPNNGHGAANGNNAASPRGVAFPDAPPMITHSYSYEAREIKSRQASFKGKSADYDRERPKSVAFDNESFKPEKHGDDFVTRRLSVINPCDAGEAAEGQGEEKAGEGF